MVRGTCELAEQASRLGEAHRAAGVCPFGDLADGGDALLMGALGEGSPTTAGNFGERLAAVAAYEGALAGEGAG